MAGLGTRRGRHVALAVALSLTGGWAVVLGVPWLATAARPVGSAQPRPHDSTAFWTSSRMRQAVVAHAALKPAASPRPGSFVADSAPSDPLTGQSFAGTPSVGALFYTDSNGGLTSHYCTASVVASPTKDVVITAAHCLYQPGSGSYDNIAFVPGYHDGQEPYGVWLPTRVLVPQNWTNSADPDDDYGFMVVHRSTDSSTDLQDVTGANELGTDPGYHSMVRVPGYPASSDQPVTCQNYTSEQSNTQLQWDCANYPAGTSGSPMLTDIDPDTGHGTIVGVIGGYEEGGDSDNVSYSSYFSDDVRSLYHEAITGS